MPILLLIVAILLVAAVVYLARSTVRVPPGHVGVVYRRYGVVHRDDRDREIRVHPSSPGYQADTLRPDRVYLRPAFLYRVENVPRTSVPPGTIGLVIAKDGAPPPLTRSLCAAVACAGFEDGAAFLAGGGEKGRQPGVLPGDASYAVNTRLFEVITVDTVGTGRDDLTADDLREVEIPEGSAGVVVVREGEAPEEEGSVGHRVPGHEDFQLPAVFLAGGGQRGAQEQTLSRGRYRINPWFAQIIKIPTRVIVLEWSKWTKPTTNFDSALGQIRINVEGYWIRIDMTQTIRIPAKAAPGLVSRLGADAESGPVRRFVDKVLAPTVEGYFHRAQAGYTIMDFLANGEEVRLNLEKLVRDALSEWDVEAISTTLSEFEPEGTTLDELRRSIADERERQEMLRHRYTSAELAAKTTRIEIGLDREREKLAVVKLEEQVRILGKDTVALNQFLAELAKMNVPQYVGTDAQALLQYMPLSAAQDLINNALRRQYPQVEGQHRVEIARDPAQGGSGGPAPLEDGAIDVDDPGEWTVPLRRGGDTGRG
ncbi:hypothetical protein Sme01_58900 [Sphaerisporangium melleum]|uniref:Band 7 domain-containing protein n=1 Tax=Sphaerisporangium melleum TaxID=321316 RepID=A0A917R7L4_9ACTN|nr:SPFH domain-containing protein [Sphaerisporangium melleum]GGK93407.1 hypothetical protein GCM10007964_39850 [Sphaerisporangium melleum]GII73414.1 hypothetical protein Sme01_58900 [Sphaerisporangium melleum]